jgi:hypothetical protein
MHNGSTIDDTMGCILVGSAYGDIGGKPGIVGSRAALERLRGIFPEKFTLKIL